MAAKELIDYLENGNITNSVNLPNVSSPRDTDCRLCVVHRNIPNMLSQISGVVSSGGLNIENMINKAKKDYAYTILDLQADGVDSNVVDQILAIDGVIRVRVID